LSQLLDTVPGRDRLKVQLNVASLVVIEAGHDARVPLGQAAKAFFPNLSVFPIDLKDLGYVLKGAIELVYGEEIIRIETGDAIHFDPSIPHRAQNADNIEAKCIVVIAGEKSYPKSR